MTVTGVSERLGALRGPTREESGRLEKAVQEALSRSLAAWAETVTSTIEMASRDLRWITEDEVAALLATRPGTADARPPST